MQLNYIIPTSGQKQAPVNYRSPFLVNGWSGTFLLSIVSYVLTETRWQKLCSYVVLAQFKFMKCALDTAKWMNSSINEIKLYK